MSRKRFSKVPHWLLDMIASGDLPGEVLRTYVALGKYVRYDKDEQPVWPSQATLAADTGLSDRSVREHLRLMEAAGVISRSTRSTSRGRSSDLITLASHRPPAAEPAGSEAPVGTGSGLPGNERQLNETLSSLPVVDEDAATTQEVTNPHSVGVAAAASHSVTAPATVPVVLQRKLQDMGVTDGTAWTSAWQTATSVVWPDFAAFEAEHFPEEHLMLHLLQQQDRGQTISPSRWLRFFLEDRQRRIAVIAGQIEQEARMSETPQEREDRLNRRLPPIWPDEPRPAATTGEKP